MEKKFFAICLGANGGPSGSGVSTGYASKDGALEWAAQQLGQKPNTHQVMIVESISIVERDRSPIKVTEILHPGADLQLVG